jgi:hypothetical protein
MHRTIKLSNTPHTANLGTLTDYRITIKAGEIDVSPDLTARTAGADFEAVFYGKQRREIITAPPPKEVTVTYPNPDYDPDTDTPEMLTDTQYTDSYEIGPVELDEGETPLSLAKRVKLKEIADARNAALDNGGAEYKGLHFWTDKGSKGDVLFAIAAYDKTETLEPVWKAKDGLLNVESIADLTGIAAAVGQYVKAQYAREFELIAKIQESETIEEVEKIFFETGV